jgi:hypothetical protein
MRHDAILKDTNFDRQENLLVARCMTTAEDNDLNN